MGECSLSIIDHGLTRLFYWLGVKIGQNPSYFLIVPFFMALLLGTGMQRLNYVDDPEYLFSPVDGAAKTERLIVESLFPMNYTHRFHPSRFVRPGRFARLFIQALDGGTLLRQDVFKEIQELDQLIHNITIVYDEDEFKYDSLCAAWEGDCYENDVMELGDSMAAIETKNISLTWPFFLTPNTYKTLGFPFIFGGYKISNRSTIDFVKALQLNYFIAVNTPKQDSRGEQWEQKVLDTLDLMEGKWKHIKVARFTVRTLAQELEKNTFSVLPYFSVTAIWMVVFMIITCMMMDWVKSKPWLGIVGVISACLGSLAAFGLVCYCGVEFIGINMAAPFLMLGIGIDDTFVMLASWRRTSPHDPVPQRMGETYAEAAVSITITSITDMLSFWVGVITPFPCVQIFSIYSGAAVVATYIWHIFFFGGAIAWSGYHEAENRHSFLCWYTTTPRSKTKGKSFWYRLWCTGGIDPDDPYNPKDNPDHGIMVFFRDYWGAFLNMTPVKIVVLAMFIAYLGVSCWGITKIQEGLERRKLTRYDSYAATFFDMEDQYFRDYPYRIQVVVSGELDYSNKTVQHTIEKMMRQFETSPYCSPQFTESWLRNFVNYVERSKDIFDFNITTEEQFLKTLTEEYIDSSSFYYDDIKFNENNTKIVASRFVIQSVNISDSNKERDMADTLRAIAKNQTGLNVTVFHPFFVFFDQFLLIRQTSINCVAIAAFIMMGVSLIFIPNPLCSLWVAFSIVSIEAGVVGFMSLWNVNLDAISMMNLIMCIGFSVDFSAHISYAYIAAKVDTPEERVKQCLYSLGLPIVQGAISTILGVIALLVAPSYIFITFFKVIFLVIFIAAMHGLLLLPVLLSLFGPGSCKKFCGDDNSLEMMSTEERKDKVVPYSFVVTPAGLDPKLSQGTDKYGRRWSTAQGYPGNMGLHGGQFVNGGVIPRINGLKTQKAASPPSRNSLERDLGIGTSGEDESSESSLSKKNKRSSSNKVNHVKELYNNEGYLSDDEELAQSAPPTANGVVQQQPRRAGGTLTNSLNHPRHSSSNSHNININNNNNTISNTNTRKDQSQRNRSGSLPQNAPDAAAMSGVVHINSTLPNGNARRKSSRGSYVSESKFP
ncbi:unnamed protein product [Orchesella dallaii]|uniref:SSD domain-containing protein n=1 Tax=Orchesella dallaii TaxID=48710 RepID=A0ABP1QYY0_9HEXA